MAASLALSVLLMFASALDPENSAVAAAVQIAVRMSGVIRFAARHNGSAPWTAPAGGASVACYSLPIRFRYAASSRSSFSFSTPGTALGPGVSKTIQVSLSRSYSGHSGAPLPFGSPVLAKRVQ